MYPYPIGLIKRWIANYLRGIQQKFGLRRGKQGVPQMESYRLALLPQAIAGSTWGSYKETLSKTYKAIGGSFSKYGGQLKDSNYKRQQTEQ